MTTPDSSRLHLTRFTTADRRCYAAYRRLKYQVFVAEQGWQGLTDDPDARIASADVFDKGASLWLATTEDGQAAGIVRTLQVTRGFPHRELFDRHRVQLEDNGVSRTLATINALAVDRDHRRTTCDVIGTPWHATVGRLLVLAALADLEANGCHAVVATAGGIPSLRLFRGLGFLVLDPPRRTELHADLILTNVGLVLTSATYANARSGHGFGFATHGAITRTVDSRLLAYFERCDSEVLQGGSTAPQGIGSGPQTLYRRGGGEGASRLPDPVADRPTRAQH